MNSPTQVVFDHIKLDPELIQRAAVFAAAVAVLNRNRNYLGEVHAPVTLVTDRLPLIKETRSSCNFSKKQETYYGTCWCGSDYHGGTLIWINHRNADLGVPRSRSSVIETLIHELAHAYTVGKHSWTFRRMYALLRPHITELFGEVDRPYDVKVLIKRYQRTHSTERTTGAYSNYLIDSFDRRDEEYAKHQAACDRMTKRLRKIGLAP